MRCAGPGQAVGDLSGGNQQKVALGRLLHQDADVLLLDEPTRGVDVGSKAEIYRLIGELAAQGKAVLFVSSYLPELLGVCDRLAVMTRGRLSAARPVAEWTPEQVMAVATGFSEGAGRRRLRRRPLFVGLFTIRKSVKSKLIRRFATADNNRDGSRGFRPGRPRSRAAKGDQRMVRSQWIGPVFGVLAWTGLAWGQMTPIAAEADGTKDRYVIGAGGGQTSATVQGPENVDEWGRRPGLPGAGPGHRRADDHHGDRPSLPTAGGPVRSMPMHIFHWG